jgi:hypothetical protein
MKGGQFVKLPREVLESDAWRGLSINARRFLDFLMIEHMRHGARENGALLAPRRQLEDFGIGRHFISAAIDEIERAGLVHCVRGTGRRPSFYGLSWLPQRQGAAPVAGANQHPQEMGAVSSKNGCQTAPTKPVAGAKRHPQRPKSRGAKQHHPSRESYHSGGNLSEVEGSELPHGVRAV